MSTMSEDGRPLSILNYPASRLSGPRLLHQIVQTDSSDGIPAIDFLPDTVTNNSPTSSPFDQHRSVSYRKLHHDSDRLAARIWELGGRDAVITKFIVPVLLPQGPELYVALLAILKAGGAFCPLNLDIPLERARFILDDVSATVVITNSELSSRIPADTNTIIYRIDDTDFSTQPPPTTSKDCRVPIPSDLAYVMYTSGSTGTPKGVGVSHDAATQSLLAHNRHIPEFSRFLQFAAPTFDVSVFEIFFPLFRGKTLVSCSRSAMLNDLPGVITAMDVDACELTPTVAGSLLRKRQNAPSLKLLLTIGEMLTKPVVEEFGGGPGGKESMLWAMYGPTEAAIHCTLQPAFSNGSGVGNIGSPLDTVSAFILDMSEDGDTSEQADLRILPRGEVGELAVGGYQAADGYINRPEMTAKAFIQTPHGRLYRTGDKARIRADGTLECLGRISEGQVKLRGQRIELGEIEHAALKAPGCHSAFAAVIRNILVLFCAVDDVSAKGSSARAIQKSCDEWLPRFMVPGDIVVMSEFPRLPSGKADRKRLVAEYSETRGAPEDGGQISEKDRSDSSDQVEITLCRVASEVLGVDVDPDQYLTRAGMDSLIAIKFASALRQVGIEVSVADILGARTISALRGRLQIVPKSITLTASSSFEKIDPAGPDISKKLSTVPALHGIPEKDITRIYPCTPLQVAMLAETKMNPRTYCNWVELSFPSEHDGNVIISSFLQISQANEALRTGFVFDGERFHQVVFAELDSSFATFVNAEHIVKEFEMSTDMDFLRPFRVQIATDPDPKTRTVVLQLHHAVYDGWSMDIILDQLAALLEQPAKVIEQPPRVKSPAPRALIRLPKTMTQTLRAFARSSKSLVQLTKGQQLPKAPPRVTEDVSKVRTASPKARPQFHEVAAYYHSDLFQNDSETAREYWAANLAGYQPPSFPVLRGDQSSRSDIVSTSLSFELLTTYLREALSSIDISQQTIFQAAVAWLWGSLVGVEDIVFGTVTSGRTIPVAGIEDIVGPCIASIPIRTNLANFRTVRDLIAGIHAANRAVLRHGVLPLSEIKKVAGLRAGQSMYDLLFVYQESLYSKRGSCRTVERVAERDYLETKILIEVEPREELQHQDQSRFHCTFTYQSKYIPEKFIEIFGASIQAVALAILEDFNRELPELQQSFPRSVLSIHNPAYERFKGIPDLALAVEAAATECADKDALCFADFISEDTLKTTTISFSGLNRMANQIAWLIREHGVDEGEPVAIVMEKSVLLYAGILAILKAGCAYLPLLPSTPLARIDTIFSQANIKVCITDTATKAAMKDVFPCNLIDIQTTPLESFPSSNPDRTVDPTRISYIIYTSGSTGTPKGVCVTQLNIMSNLDVLSQIYPVTNESRLLQSCSQAFDVSVFEIFFSWTRGMCLCSATNDVLFADLEHSIRKLGVTHLSMTPTVASLISPENVPRVEFLVTSGEAMTEVVARKWARQLYQGYGPSETTNICSVKKMDSGPQRPIIQHLGWSFKNTSTFVLFRDSLEVAPKGCFGELCFGGDQVAQGYLNMPDLTAAKFIQHPQHGRLYRSGDLGRMLPDGSMVITGRVDDQIKIRGQRVELGEISTIVGQSEAVADCTTLFINGDGTRKEMIAVFFVPKEESKESHFHLMEIDQSLSQVVQDIFHDLSARVPGYMVPAVVIPLSVLPVTPAGKLDRRRLEETLRALDQDYLVLASQRADPESREDDGTWSDNERQIATIVATVFGVDKSEIRRWTPLALLGLDSISAIRLSKQLHDGLDARVPITTILLNPTVGKLAQAVAGVGHRHGDSSAFEKDMELLPPEITQSITARLKHQGSVAEGILPCTALQEAMLIASSEGSYLNKMLFRINGDPKSVMLAWNAMCQRHGILRTCFVSTESPRWPVVQVVLENWEHSWLEIDASGREMEHCVSEHASTLPVALDTLQPVVSFATLLRGTETYFSFVCHHALYDGVAMERLLFEVEQHVSGVHLVAPPAYESFIQCSLGLQTDESLGFWLNHLDDHKPKLITGFKASGSKMFSQPTVSRTLEMGLSQLNGMTKHLGVSLRSVTQSAWSITLANLFQSDDVCFGSVVSGRTLPIDRIDDVVAPCFNTVPIRVNLCDAGSCNLDVVKVLQHLGTELLQHQFTPLRRILQELSSRFHSQSDMENNKSIGRGHGHFKLFDTLFLLQHPPRLLDESIWSLEKDEGSMDVPVVCEVIPDTHSNMLIIHLHLERNRFPLELPGIVLDLFFNALHSLLRYPDSSISLRDSLSLDLRQRLDRLSYERPAIQDSGFESNSEDENTWTPTECTIRTALSTLSSYAQTRINRATSIYQLGLDSISAVQIASLLRKQGLNLTASDVISNPTCESLARHLEALRAPSNRQGATFDLPGFQRQVQSQIEEYGFGPGVVEDVLPCSALQAGMMAQFLQSDGKDYFNYIDFEMDNTIDVEALLGAWRVLYHAHPILRTRLVPIEHGDHSYAMVQFRSSFYPLPVSSHVELGNVFCVEKWRLDAAHNAAMAPHGQLWNVALVKTDQGIFQHLAIHHCLYDAHSLQLLLADLAKAVRGEQIKPTLQANMRLAVTEILTQSSASAGSSQGFWESQANKTVINSFPVMTPLRESPRQVLVESFTGSLGFMKVERAVAESGYSMQIVLQAAWTRILSSYLGETAVVFGVVLSGRNTEATQNAMVPCITTLPVISTNKASNQELLQQMLGYNSDLFKQQHQPLTRIQRWLGVPEARLFDTLLVYQKFDVDTCSVQPWRVISDQATVDYPLSIEIEPQPGDKLKYSMTFFSDVLPKEQAQILLQQFDALVTHLALRPAGNEDDLLQHAPGLFSVLPPQKPHLPGPVRFLHQFVEKQASETPHYTALQFVDSLDGDKVVGRKWSYQELDENGNRVANLILPRVKPGDLVAINFDKRPEAYFSILGVLKAGCSFVALDPEAPAQRKQFIIQDSGAALILSSKEQGGNLTLNLEISVPVLVVEEQVLSRQPSHRPILSREIEPSDVCYCLYTSGTTGVPKGCEITHENTVQCMLAFKEIFQGRWSHSSRWLQFASLHFDVSVLEQYWSWSVGITLVGAPRDLILEDLSGTISKLEITHIDLTPSLARLVHPDDVPTLCSGVFITGGESLKQEILDVWGSQGVIYNFYGPTEATIGVTVYPRVPQNGRASNIGRQFLNVGSYVLKPGTSTPVLKGAVGELCVSGKLVGKGYLRRDDLTAERFPTLEHFGERVYRTGDLVRVLHDGCFEFLGRADDQVKLRGQRLEIGEINHAIRTGVQEIMDVATIVVRNERQEKDFLVSFITAESQVRSWSGREKPQVINNLEAQHLCRSARLACQSKLPGYMVPTYILQLPFIPLSPNNKAEIKELKTLFQDLSQDELVTLSSWANGSGSRMLTESGNKIARVIAAMQAVDSHTISAATSIFELGIDSISVLRLARALRTEGFPQASPSVILKNPMLGDLSHALDSQQPSQTVSLVAAARQTVRACAHRHGSQVSRELGISQQEIEYIAPCSPLQAGMISRSALDGAYFNTFKFKLETGASVSTLHQAWQKTVDAFPVLRTVFIKTTDGYVQVALKNRRVPWQTINCISSNSPNSRAESTIKARWEAWVADNSENLTRPTELLLVDNELLVLHLFHGLYDANSLDMVFERVLAEYRALEKPATSKREETDVNNIPSFLEALCHGPLQSFGSCRQFWVDHLRDVKIDPLRRADHPWTSLAVSARREVSFHQLEILRTCLGVTHQALIQAAWCWVLFKHFSFEPTIGMIVSGRAMELDGADRVVGPLFNTLPFRLRVPRKSDLSWSSIIRQCHEFNSSVMAFQHVPLRDIQKWCSSSQPVFDILFSFRRQEQCVAESNRVWEEVDTHLLADYPLALEATLTPSNTLCLLVVGDGAAVKEADVQALLHTLESSLGSMARSPDEPLVAEGLLQNGASHDIMSNGDKDKAGHAPHGDFTWSEKATVIRDEIARLAGIASDSVTESTSILELGLDSIDLIKLSAALKRHDIQIKTSQLMKAGTIPAIVSSSAQHQGIANHSVTTTEASTYPELRKLLVTRGYGLDQIKLVLPATPLQDSMVAEMIESNFKHYYNHDILEIAPEADLDRLVNAWMSVIRGSPILRTTFITTNDQRFDFGYCQVVTNDQDAGIHITEKDVRGQQDLGQLVDAATQRAREGNGTSHLVQLSIARSTDKTWLVLSIAHALYDGQSLALLHQDVQAAYEGHYETRQPYERYIEEVIFAQSDDAPTFWSEFLDGAVPTMIPPRLEAAARNESVNRAEAASALTMTDIKMFCKSHAITMQTLGQACMAALLATRTASLDVTFGVVLSGRDTEAAESLMFPTMNTVAMRSILHGTVSSWIQYLQDNAANVAPFSHFPLRKAKKLVKGLSGPLFNALFIQQRPSDSEQVARARRIMKSVDGSSAVEYPVCVEMEVAEDTVAWRVACNDSYISKQDVSMLLHQLDLVLRFMIEEPDSDVIRFSGQGVSVCGLPEFVPRCTMTEEEGAEDATAEEDTQISPLEETIIGVLADISGVPASSIFKTHNIYNLGLDSIGAMRASSALWKKENIMLKYRDIVGAKSIRDMARLVNMSQDSVPSDGGESRNRQKDSAQDGQSTLVTFPLHEQDSQMPVDERLSDVSAQLSHPDTSLSNLFGRFNCSLSEQWVERVLPATAMQVHMLSVWLNTQGAVFYSEFKYNLKGHTDIDEMASAWAKLTAELPILRTVFCATIWDNMPMLQLVLKSGIANSPTGYLLEDTRDVESRTWWSLPGEVVSLAQQPVPAITVTKQSDGSWQLRLRLHHALYDAVSLPGIMKRFSELCTDARVDKRAEQECSNWRAMIKLCNSRDNKAKSQEFWTKYLDGAMSTPFNLPRTARNLSNSRVSLVRTSAVSDVSGLRSLCEKNGISIQALFLAAYAQYLASLQESNVAASVVDSEPPSVCGSPLALTPDSHSEAQLQEESRQDSGYSSNSAAKSQVRPDVSRDVVFGVYLANRTDFESTDGLSHYPTLCLVPLRVRVSRAKSLIELAIEIQEDLHMISSAENVGVGLWEIQQWTGLVVHSFVNFLSFPGSDLKTEEQSQRENSVLSRVVLKEVSFGGQHDDSASMNPGFILPSGFQNLRSTVRSAYPDAVDVEVSLHQDKSMTLGVFGSRQKLGDENGASEVIEGIVGVLLQAVSLGP
ncbi:non-ribosomal peptide synthetase [Rhypophila sp. PSN 637]